jgi:hypothetical protein
MRTTDPYNSLTLLDPNSGDIYFPQEHHIDLILDTMANDGVYSGVSEVMEVPVAGGPQVESYSGQEETHGELDRR